MTRNFITNNSTSMIHIILISNIFPLFLQTPSSQGESTQKTVRRESTLTDSCSICRQKVYVMERHMDGSKLYHRRCIREQQRSQRSPTRQKLPTEKKAFGLGSGAVARSERLVHSARGNRVVDFDG